MSFFDVSKAEYNNQLRMLEPTDPGHADIFNAALGQLISNDAAIKEEVEEAKKSGGSYIGPDEPPNTKLLWIDTGNDGILKYHNGTAWIPLKAVWG